MYRCCMKCILRAPFQSLLQGVPLMRVWCIGGLPYLPLLYVHCLVSSHLQRAPSIMLSFHFPISIAMIALLQINLFLLVQFSKPPSIDEAFSFYSRVMILSLLRERTLLFKVRSKQTYTPMLILMLGFATLTYQKCRILTKLF